MLLIGSHAVNRHIPGFRQNPGDVDVIATPDEVSDFRKFGWVDHPHDGSNTVLRAPNGVLWDIELETPLTQALYAHSMEGVPSLDVLYTLKLSHRYLKDSPHFLKTMRDIRALRARGCTVFDPAWLKERERVTYHYQHPNLKRSKTDFFQGDAVEYLYDHDSLHEAVKLEEVPAYTRFSVDGQEVLSSRAKFEALSYEHRLHAVVEESYVLALERSQIPFAGQISAIDSFKIALQKVCTSITSGWFREFAWENYYSALLLFRPDYVAEFEKALTEGRIKEFCK